MNGVLWLVMATHGAASAASTAPAQGTERAWWSSPQRSSSRGTTTRTGRSRRRRVRSPSSSTTSNSNGCPTGTVGTIATSWVDRSVLGSSPATAWAAQPRQATRTRCGTSTQRSVFSMWAENAPNGGPDRSHRSSQWVEAPIRNPTPTGSGSVAPRSSCWVPLTRR
jgi:hypothetical protein